MLTRIFRQFLQLNIKICDHIESLLPEAFTASLLYKHEQIAGKLLNVKNDSVALDVGGGHLSFFAKYRKPDNNDYIIATDILYDQIRNNNYVDSGFVADARSCLPLKSESVDIISTRSVLEHLDNNAQFFAESNRILKPGGHSINVFPCKYTPFAIINQILPNHIAQNILYFVFPQWKDECGFKAYYKNCYFPKIQKVMEDAGFTTENIYLRYYQSIYFKFFVPFYLISLIYDLTLWALNLKPLACQILLVGKKIHKDS